MDYATRVAQIRADFADVETKRIAREQKEKEKDKSNWIAGGRKRIASFRKTFSDNNRLGVPRLNSWTMSDSSC